MNWTSRYAGCRRRNRGPALSFHARHRVAAQIFRSILRTYEGARRLRDRNPGSAYNLVRAHGRLTCKSHCHTQTWVRGKAAGFILSQAKTPQYAASSATGKQANNWRQGIVRPLTGNSSPVKMFSRRVPRTSEGSCSSALPQTSPIGGCTRPRIRV